MPNNSLLLVLGNQLFPLQHMQAAAADFIFMAEDLGLCTYEKHHKLKILMFLAAMREKRDELQTHNLTVDYVDIDHPSFDQAYEQKLASCILEREVTSLTIFEIEDKDFEVRIHTFAAQQNLTLTVLPSPMFILNRQEFLSFSGKAKVLRMGNFYKEVRKKLNLLVDEEQKPLGGKWSFDEDNRKKIPKGLLLPEQYVPAKCAYIEPLKATINIKFASHPGQMNDVWMPLTRQDALEHIDHFLTVKFENFGIYEDAILHCET